LRSQAKKRTAVDLVPSHRVHSDKQQEPELEPKGNWNGTERNPKVFAREHGDTVTRLRKKNESINLSTNRSNNHSIGALPMRCIACIALHPVVQERNGALLGAFRCDMVGICKAKYAFAGEQQVVPSFFPFLSSVLPSSFPRWMDACMDGWMESMRLSTVRYSTVRYNTANFRTMVREGRESYVTKEW